MLTGLTFGLALLSWSPQKVNISGLVTIRGRDTRSLRLLLRTNRKEQTNLAETIASDGTYRLEGEAPSDSVVITLSTRQVGFAGGPWHPVSGTTKLDIDAIRLTGKDVRITPKECVQILVSGATTCALQLDAKQAIPPAVLLNSRIALHREQSLPDQDVLKEAIQTAKNSSVPEAQAWLMKIERELKRANQPLPNYQELDPESILTRLQTLTGDAAMCEGMLALSFDADEFLANWKPELLRAKFAESIGIEGIHPATIEYQVSDLTEPNPAMSPMLSFRRERGVTADDLQRWAQDSPTVRLYLFRLAVANLAKDETVRNRAASLLARYRPRLRINL